MKINTYMKTSMGFFPSLPMIRTEANSNLQLTQCACGRKQEINEFIENSLQFDNPVITINSRAIKQCYWSLISYQVGSLGVVFVTSTYWDYHPPLRHGVSSPREEPTAYMYLYT